MYSVAGLYAITATNNIIDSFVLRADGKLTQTSIDNISTLLGAIGKGFMAAWFIGVGYVIYKYVL